MGGKWCPGNTFGPRFAVDGRQECARSCQSVGGTPLRCLRRDTAVGLVLQIKGWWVYPFDPRSDAVVLYSGCTPGKRHSWFLLDDRHTASLVGLRGGWRHARTKMFTRTYGSNAAGPSFHIVFYHSGKPLALRIFNKTNHTIGSRLPEPISASALDNSLNTSTSSLSTEACPAPTTSNKFAALQPSVPLSESATTTSNSELSNTSKVP
ncbi:hypothetical protein TNCV_4064441 [Trichonephila clavipes]|nr:hypothetical protein TNCV_4064441 [Trichonephila clavipes]